MLGTVQDVTERKLAEQELMVSKRTIDAILETVGEGVMAVEPDMKITYVNEKLAGSSFFFTLQKG